MPTPVPIPTPTPWEVYQAKLADYMAKAQAAMPTPTPLPSYGVGPAMPPPPTMQQQAMQGLSGGLKAGLAHQLLGAGGEQLAASAAENAAWNAGADLATNAAWNAGADIATEQLGQQAASQLAQSAAENAAWNSGAEAAGSQIAEQGASQLAGPGTFGYWAGPAAFIASAPVWAPILAKYGNKAGESVFKATGLKKKRFDRPYTAEGAATSAIINRQLPGLAQLDGAKKSKILDALRGAKALIVPAASSPDFSKAESNTRDASRIGISSAYLTDREKDKLKSKYGKNYHFGAIKAEDLVSLLSPIGRNDKGVQRLNTIKKAIKDAGKS